MASTMGFGEATTRGVSDFEFDYVESGGGEEQQLDLNIEESKEPLSVAICGGHYAVATFASKVLIIDLERANERLLYNSYSRSLQSGTAVSQQLLFPELLTLTEEEYDLVEEYAVDFASLGFDIKAKGNLSIEVFGIPADISTEQLDRTIYDILQSLKLPQLVVEARREALAQVLARCASAGRKSFTQAEAEYITSQIVSMAESYTPAGKCIILSITILDIKNRLE